MKNLIISFTLFCIVAFPVVTSCNEKGKSEFEKIADEVRTAVIKEDVKILLKYVSSTGTSFVDDHYTFGEIRELLKNKDSWLCKHLFWGENSIKKYFENAEGLTIKIHYYNKDKAVSIFYQSLNNAPRNWVECCFIKINEKWYFNGIFYCE